MCGIAVLIGRPGVNVAPYIGPMCEFIRHRGPDDEGYALVGGSPPVARFYSGKDTLKAAKGCQLPYAPIGSLSSGASAQVAMGHRRLAVLDLSPAAHQPMADDTKRHLIVYNGEVYNHVELRKELEAFGHRFRSHSDTEVVLTAWRQWGKECLSRFNGMFAFVILDLERGKVFAARDRFGVKPLYWWRSPSGFIAFASEIKQFTRLPGWQARLNGARAYDYLNWAVSDHSVETLFDGVYQLAGGEYILEDVDEVAEGVQPQRWYTLRPQRVEMSFEAAAAHFQTLFEDSVRLRLRADVPIGTGLSGGLDSSSIVCMANRLLREQGAHGLQNTFSACSHDPRFDERCFIEIVAQYTGVATHFIFPELNGLFSILGDLIWHHDEPFLSTSVYAEWCVFGLVRDRGVTVTLDGHGADELLAGYHGFFGNRLASLLWRGDLTALVREIMAMRQRFDYRLSHLLLRMLDVLLPESLRQPLRRMCGRAATGVPWLDVERLGVAEKDPFHAVAGESIGIRDLSKTQLLHTSLPMQLKWADRDSMAHSVESRTPFLDYRLVEFVLGCPDEFKLKAGVTKRILRSGLVRLLPPEISGRVDKMGFVTPEAAWVREQAPERFQKAVAESIEASRGVLTPAALTTAEEIVSGRRPYDNVLWRWICFGYWMERFAVTL